MAASIVYSSVVGAVLGSLPALSTRFIAFDTSVVDLTDELNDPVDLLFGVRLGGGTDMERAVTYCRQLVTRPQDTIMVVITDLYEGGDQAKLLRRFREIVEAGVRLIVLLALSDQGRPAYNHELAARLPALGVPAFACTPTLFPDLLAAALRGGDLRQWVAAHELA